MDKCGGDIEPNKSYEEKLDTICEVLRDYDYYKNLEEEHMTGTVDLIVNAIDECEKISKLEHYNITNKDGNEYIKED